jgi:hypothetical protein
MKYWNTGKMGLKEEKQFINDLFRFYYPTFHCPNIPSFHGSGINQELLKDL